MFIKLLILFTILPLLELYVLIQTGGLIGAFPTLGLVLTTGIAGAYLARSEGLEVLRSIQQSMQEGHLPAEALVHGALVLAGGLLLLTPGLITDCIGFSLIAPFSRTLWQRWLTRLFARGIEQGTIRIIR